jgi:hypothetical protein
VVVQVFFCLNHKERAMPEPTPKPKTDSRSLAIGFGVTERIHFLGLVLLAAGISLAVDFHWALIVVGLFLIRTAENNARERDQGNK